MSEIQYKLLIDKYLAGNIFVDNFINQYMYIWRQDRDDKTVFDEKFQRLKDRLFTSCDCYSENATEPFEISEEQLMNEVRLLSHIWWG